MQRHAGGAFSDGISHFLMRLRVTSSMIVCDHRGR